MWIFCDTPSELLRRFHNGYENFIYYEHSSTLRTIQEIFGVMPFLRDARRQRDLFAIFPEW